MDNRHEKNPQDPSATPDPRAETGALSGQAPQFAEGDAEPMSGDVAEPRLSHEQQAAEIARLAAGLREQREHFRNLEVSLVARIADVDDDRRHAATRLQRTLQTQRDELDARFKRQSALVTVLLLLFACVVAGALAYFHVTFDARREALTSQMAAIRDALEQIASVPPIPDQDPQTREKLGQLAAAVEEISKSLERLGDEALQPPAEPTQGASPAKDDAGETASPPPSGGEASRASETTEAVEQPQATQPLAPVEEGDAGPSQPDAAVLPQPEPAPPASADKPEKAVDEVAESASRSETVPVTDKPFAIQLMGFYSLESLQEFVRRHGLSSEYYYRQETYQDRPWFVLIHSLHESQKAADAIVASLPPELAKREIWVRKLDSGKQAIRVRAAGD